MLGDNIKIMILEIRGDKVRVGIEAPRELSVHRKEVYDIIKNNLLPQVEGKTIECNNTASFEELRNCYDPPKPIEEPTDKQN
jgi:carbon storage regulator